MVVQSIRDEFAALERERDELRGENDALRAAIKEVARRMRLYLMAIGKENSREMLVVLTHAVQEAHSLSRKEKP